jgi:hypothetical protein
MIDNLINVDFSNKAYNIAIMIEKIDKLKTYYEDIKTSIFLDYI